MGDERENAIENSALRDMISKLDVEAVGVASLAEWQGTRLEETALKLLPETRSVVVFAMEIYPEILNHATPERTMGAASMNNLLTQDADYLYGRLTKAAYDVARASHRIGLKALPLPARGCPLDSRFLEAVFSYKHAAQAAGLGNIGWHSLLITPDFGPRVRLSCCLTEAALGPTTAVDKTLECDSCQICLNKCPAGALSEPQADEQYAINKFACTTFLNASGGCAECMRFCPVGR